MQARTRVLAAAAVVLALFASASPATAWHWTLYHADVERSVGETFEDDGLIVHAPGNPLDGSANRIDFSGAPGDGGLFLDARAGTLVGHWSEVGVALYPGLFAAEVAGRSDLLLPGLVVVTAWYGNWLDLDRDGFIRDVHDTSCASDCALDEFRWRGLASGEGGIPMAQFWVPQSYTFVYGAGNASSFHSQVVEDHTASATGQLWRTTFWAFLDAPFLATVQSITAADAPRSPGSALGYALDGADVLIDVDRYEALSGDVESLWLAVAPAIPQLAAFAQGGALDFALDAVSGVAGDLGGLRSDADALVANARDDAFATTTWGVFGGGFFAAQAKEPNHEDDDYGDRASFGGVGDVDGSHNSYPGYADAYGLYVDNVARGRRAVGVGLAVPGTSVEATQHAVYPFTDAAGGPRALFPEQGAGTLVAFEARMYLWHDANLDTHLGHVCDPSDPEEFDAERNTCAPSRRGAWPHDTSFAAFEDELVSACTAATGRGTTFTAAPVGGAWQDVAVLRDWGELPSGVLEWEVLTGSAPVTLRWRDTCTASHLESRDALLFLGGSSSHAVRVEAAFELPSFHDAARGIDVRDERVVDVDVLAAML